MSHRTLPLSIPSNHSSNETLYIQNNAIHRITSLADANSNDSRMNDLKLFNPLQSKTHSRQSGLGNQNTLGSKSSATHVKTNRIECGHNDSTPTHHKVCPINCNMFVSFQRIHLNCNVDLKSCFNETHSTHDLPIGA